MGVQNTLRSTGAYLILLLNIRATDHHVVDVVPFAHNQHIPRSRVPVVVCPQGAIRRCEKITTPSHVSQDRSYFRRRRDR